MDPYEKLAVSCSYDNVIKKWNVERGLHDFDFPSEYGLVVTKLSSQDAVVSHDGKSLLCNNDVELVSCELQTAAVSAIHPFEFRPAATEPMRLGPTIGSLIIPMAVRGFILWNYLTGRVISRHESFPNAGIDWVRGDNPIFFGRAGNDIEMVCQRTNTYRCLKGHSDVVLNVCQVGPYLLSTSVDKSLKIWDVSSGRLIRSHCLNLRSCRPIAGCNSFVATAYEGFQIAIWDLDTLELSLVLPGHRQEISYLEWLVPRHLLASASDDMCIKVWDIKQARLLCELTVDAPITVGTYSPKNRTIVIGDGSGRVHFLKLEP
jgi:WD40 repeat protein